MCASETLGENKHTNIYFLIIIIHYAHRQTYAPTDGWGKIPGPEKKNAKPQINCVFIAQVWMKWNKKNDGGTFDVIYVYHEGKLDTAVMDTEDRYVY